jgi:hypothetical protein
LNDFVVNKDNLGFLNLPFQTFAEIYFDEEFSQDIQIFFSEKNL